MADWWGRRTPIAVGCSIMLLGALLGTFANGYGSKFCIYLRDAYEANILQCIPAADLFLVSVTA